LSDAAEAGLETENDFGILAVTGFSVGAQLFNRDFSVLRMAIEIVVFRKGAL
jgi:hypothetical protein